MDTNGFEIKPGSRDYDRLVEKLRPIYNSVKSDEYNRILTSLCSKNLDNIIDILLSVYQDKKEMKMELATIRGELMEAELDLNEKDNHISDLEKQLIGSRQRECELYCKSIGIAPEKGMLMKHDYEQGMSLRQLGKKYQCDKATAKRRLIKLGVAIRE